MLPVLAPVETQNKNIGAAFACFTTIVWINGNLLFYGCILVCSVKTDSLRGFPVFIFKTGKASNALICRDTVSV